MKQAAVVFLALGLTSSMWAQQTPATPSTGAQSGTTTSQTPKRLPQAKTQAEYQAYQAAAAKANDPAAIEAAAGDFATKYPTSELRVLLYSSAMQAYQTANNSGKMLEMGRKVLALDPDNPEALIGVSEVLVERTHDADLDKEQRWDEATKLAQHALETIETVLAPPNTPKEKLDAYKAFMRSSAYASLGTIAFNREKYTDAEAMFHKSIDALPSQPDPVVVLRLALALDKQGRYADALKEAEQAVDLGKDNPAIGEPAKHERDRLIQLTGGIPAADSTAPKN